MLFAAAICALYEKLESIPKLFRAEVIEPELPVYLGKQLPEVLEDELGWGVGAEEGFEVPYSGLRSFLVLPGLVIVHFH